MLSSCKARAALANAKHGRTGDAALGCALTEFNVTYANPADNGPAGVGSRSFLDGQFFAEIYGAAMELGTFAVLPWSLLESNGAGAPDDLGMFDLKAGAASPRPSWRHLEALARNFRGTFYAGQSGSASVKAFASRSGDTVAVLVLNESTSEGGTVAVSFSDQAPKAAAKYAVKIPMGLGLEASDTLPPESSLLFLLKGGSRIYRWAYSEADAAQGRAPKEERTPASLAPHGFGIAAVPHRDGSGWSGRGAVGAAIELRDLRGGLVRRVAADGEGVWSVDAPGPGAYVLSIRAAGASAERVVIRP
jgi:hypothetical protein